MVFGFWGAILAVTDMAPQMAPCVGVALMQIDVKKIIKCFFPLESKILKKKKSFHLFFNNYLKNIRLQTCIMIKNKFYFIILIIKSLKKKYL